MTSQETDEKYTDKFAELGQEDKENNPEYAYFLKDNIEDLREEFCDKSNEFYQYCKEHFERWCNEKNG